MNTRRLRALIGGALIGFAERLGYAHDCLGALDEDARGEIEHDGALAWRRERAESCTARAAGYVLTLEDPASSEFERETARAGIRDARAEWEAVAVIGPRFEGDHTWRRDVWREHLAEAVALALDRQAAQRGAAYARRIAHEHGDGTG